MIEIDYLEQVLKTCKSNQVHSLKTGELEIVFSNYPEASPLPGPADSTDKLKEVLTAQEQALPPDLRADDLMNADKALFWSSPDGSEVPLAGESEL